MNFSKIQNFFFFIALVGISFSFYLLLKGFSLPIFSAIVLVIVAYPMYKKILKITKNKKNLSSIISVFLVFLLIMAPLGITSSLVIKESKEVYTFLASNNDNNSGEFVKKYEVKIKNSVESMNLDYEKIKEKSVKTFKESLSYIINKSLDIGKDTLSIVISFMLTMYIMFYLFRDGEIFLKKISHVLPLGNGNEQKAFLKFSLIIKSIFKGSLVVALIQGILGGLLFYIVGIKAVLLWTVIMIILSIIPALGPPIIIMPAIVIMLLSGDNMNALILTIGVGIISVSDNFLRPIFIGNSIKMHDLILTLSILGGIGVFGILGFIIGPVIAGLFILSWELFEERYREQLMEKG